MKSLIDKHLVDKAIEAYVEWREASVWVNDAYCSWALEHGSRASVAFGSYTAALDHEERAAARYARVIGWVADVIARDDVDVPAGTPAARGASAE
jgi:hypothetical protein